MHPFGYGRVRYVYSFLVAVVLFTVGGLFAIFQGYEKIKKLHELESAIIAVGVLVVAIVLESFSLRTGPRGDVAHQGRSVLLELPKSSRVPELPVVLMEDLAALTGLVFALGGVTLTLALDEPRFDGTGTLCIGILLGAGGAARRGEDRGDPRCRPHAHRRRRRWRRERNSRGDSDGEVHLPRAGSA